MYIKPVACVVSPTTKGRGEVHTAVEERHRGSANKEGEMPQLASRVREGKITDCHFRELRHPCGTRMVRGGVGLYKAQWVLEHPSPIMAQHYAHRDPERLRNGSNILDVGRGVSTNLAQLRVVIQVACG